MTKEPRLSELQGSSRLALGFFNSIIRRIECTKPIAGDGVVLTEKEDGIQIAVSGGSVTTASLGLMTYDLNVCSNGTPAVIQVYGPSTA
jgi:hypothetical protein